MENFSVIGKQIYDSAKKDDVNLIHPFIEAPPDKKLSVIGVYDNKEQAVVNGKGDDIPFCEDDYYYGLDPSFGADEVCDAITSGVFDTADTLNRFIDGNADLFKVPVAMKSYARALFAKTLVKMSVMFGHLIECRDKTCFDEFCKTAAGVAVKDIDYDFNVSEKTIRLLGSPDAAFLSKLDDCFCVADDGKLDIIGNATGSAITVSRHLSGKAALSLVKGNSYYSGVIPHVKAFEHCDTAYSNSDVSSIAVRFGRTTFATMDAFDGSYIKKHRLLKAYIALLDELDEREDALMRKYLCDNDRPNDAILNSVNDFLAQSFSAHNLAVSGNIVTSDGFLILAQRNKKNVDSDTYYCSVNGQSEIRDGRVSFYKQSVYEDAPTLCIDGNFRIDFTGELERETKAELNISCPPQRWQLCGISFLAVLPTDSATAERRRFHFNILGECTADYTLEQVIDRRKSATEKFENSKLIGAKFTRHKNLCFRFAHLIKSAILWILKSKDLITSIFALAVFALSINDLQNSKFTVKSMSSIVSVIFTCLSIVILLKNMVAFVIELVRLRGITVKLSVIGECKDFYDDIHCRLIKNKILPHPIADVMLYEYIKKRL